MWKGWEPSGTHTGGLTLFEAHEGAGGADGEKGIEDGRTGQGKRKAKRGLVARCSVQEQSHVAQLPLASCVSTLFSEGLLIARHPSDFFLYVVVSFIACRKDTKCNGFSVNPHGPPVSTELREICKVSFNARGIATTFRTRYTVLAVS